MAGLSVAGATAASGPGTVGAACAGSRGAASGARWSAGADAPADGAARFDVLPEASPAVGAVPIALRVSGIADAAGADASGA